MADPGYRAAEQQLFHRYAELGDVAPRDELVERFLPLARELARRYAPPDESLEDLIQVASIGLLKAIDRFEPERGTEFTSYAEPTIIGELKRHFRDHGWALRVPRQLQERALGAKRFVDSLPAELGRSPTVREIALQLGCRPEDVVEALEAAASYRTISLDAPSDRDLGGAMLAELVGSDDAAY